MVQDSVRSYVEAAGELALLTRARATNAAKSLLASGGVSAEQIQGLVDDLLASSKANREALRELVRVEVERTVTRLGFSTADEVRSLRDRLDAVEVTLRGAAGGPKKAGTTVRKPRAASKTASAKPASSRAARPPVGPLSDVSPTAAKTPSVAKRTSVKKPPSRGAR